MRDQNDFSSDETKGTVLIVDDEDAIRRLIRDTLERNGYSSVEASNVARAREQLQAYACDVMLCDIRMPGESGLDLVRFVKGAAPDVAVIMVTGVDDMRIATEALSLGLYGYLLKPISRTQILITVANSIRRRQLELQQRASRELLEKLVSERTRELQQVNERLKRREAELDLRTKELEEMNGALRVLLRKGESDRRELQDDVLTNVAQTITPYLDKLKRASLSEAQQRDLNILETNVRKIISPFARELSAPHLGLTPTELQVASLIKQGKGTKEISSILNLSTNTVMTHRFKIRTKLGLKNNKQNLRSYLGSLP
ncbi:MAG: response regulator [Syntrophobacteraceae bacterium]